MTEAIPRHLLAFEHHPLYAELLQGHLIRLVDLKPGAHDAPIIMSLFIVDLEYAPEYEALSYVWGDPTNRVPIQCNGRQLNVTVNLDAALRRIRHTDRSRMIWADAICINQTNNRECSYHVSFMDRIYRHAKHVLVCMGDDDAQNVGAKEVKMLIEEYEKRASDFKAIPEMPILAPTDPTLDDPRWKSFGYLMKRPWFTRAWTLQEVGVAEKPIALYGNEEFDYRHLTQMSRWLTRCAPGLQSKADIVLWTVHTDWEYWSPDWRNTSENPEYTLLDFLQHARSLSCRRSHDHIYAFLGHPLAQLPDGSGPVITPNYDHPVEEVFMDISMFLLKEYGLCVLSAVEQDEKSILDDFPSWAINWDVELTQCSFGYWGGFYYAAATAVTLDTPFAREGNGLKIRGQVVDVVAKVYQFSVTSDNLEKPAVLKDRAPEDYAPGILDTIWTDLQGGETECVYPPDKKLEVFSLTLVAGLTNYKRAEDDTDAHAAHFAAYWRLRTKTAHAQSPRELEQAGQEGDPDRFWFDMSLACEGRTFIITKNGYFGLGPWIAKEGDVCCLLYGARVPIVLRRRTGSSSYRLVGESYVHGIMAGEALRKDEGLDIVIE
jgi:hypothetical protein